MLPQINASPTKNKYSSVRMLMNWIYCKNPWPAEIRFRNAIKLTPPATDRLNPTKRMNIRKIKALISHKTACTRFTSLYGRGHAFIRF